MIASLPMYDTPATRTSNNIFWQSIRRRYGRGPEHLRRDTDVFRMWRDPSLVFSQTCGLPFRRELHDVVQLVGTPDYAVPGCPPGYYNSVLAVSAGDRRNSIQDFHDATLARNDAMSQSGWAAIVDHLEQQRAGFSFGTRVLDTGSHAASVSAVTQGDADIASIDAVTWALLERDTSATEGLRVLARTEPTPGLPYITSASENRTKLHAAVCDAIAQLPQPDRQCLMLRGLVDLPADAYHAVPLP